MPERRGRLIAVEGSRAKDVVDVATAIAAEARAGRRRIGITRWDASGLFGEIVSGKPRELRLSPRTVLLLYAADLAFRLRWEIRPALAAGEHVIAAPYVLTAIAWGEAARLPGAWVRELFRFAPEPDATYRAPERKRRAGWKAAVGKGLAEFATVAAALGEDVELRNRMIDRLDRYERRGRCALLTRKAARAERRANISGGEFREARDVDITGRAGSAGSART